MARSYYDKIRANLAGYHRVNEPLGTIRSSMSMEQHALKIVNSRDIWWSKF
jgi:hypothetical protein